MGRQLFLTEIPIEVKNQNLTGAQLSAMGYAVDKFAPASLDPLIVQDNAEGTGTQESFAGNQLIGNLDNDFILANDAGTQWTLASSTINFGDTFTGVTEDGLIFRVEGGAINGGQLQTGICYVGDVVSTGRGAAGTQQQGDFTVTIQNVRPLNAEGVAGAALNNLVDHSLSGFATLRAFTTTVTPATSTGFESIAGITVDATARNIVIQNGSTPLPEGLFFLKNWNVFIGEGNVSGNLRIANGNNTEAESQNRNVSFYNCNIHYVNVHQYSNTFDFAIGFGNATAGGGNVRTFPQGAGPGRTAANTRSINSYGSTHTWYSNASVRSSRWADFIQSEFIYYNFSGGGVQFPTGNGSRWIGSSVYKYGGGALGVNPYGQTEIASSNFANLLFNHGNTGDRQPNNFVFDRPSFVDPNQTTYFGLNAGAQGTNGIIQLIGGPSIGRNVTEALGTNTGGNVLRGGVIETDAFDRARGGVLQYQGFGNSYFSDAQLTQGAEGVRARVTVNVNPTTIENTSGTVGDRLNSNNGAFTNGQVTNIGVTNSDGVLSTSQYQLGTDGPLTNGHIDFFAWDTSTTVGSTAWATTQETVSGVRQVSSPEGLMIAPIARAYTNNNTASDANRAYNSMNVTQSARSFRWDVHQNDTSLPFADARTDLSIADGNIVVSDLQGTVVKSQNVGVDNRPIITFPNNADRSINDIRDGYRGSWYGYVFDLDVPASGVATLTDPLALTLNIGTNPESFAAGALSLRTPNLAGTTGDLFRTESNITTLNMNGGDISDHILSSSGAMTNIGAVVSSTLTPSGTANTFAQGSSHRFSTLNGNWTANTVVGYNNCTLPGSYFHTDGPTFVDNNFTGTITVGANFIISRGTFDGTVNSSGGNVTIVTGTTVGDNATLATIAGDGQLILGANVDASRLDLPTVSGNVLSLGAGATAPTNAADRGWTITSADEPRTFGYNGPATGYFVFKERGATGVGTLIDLRNDAHNRNDMIPSQTTRTNTNYDIWYIPDSTVNGVGGATANAFYDYAFAQWNPSLNQNTVIQANQIDTDGVIITGVDATSFNASDVVAASSLDGAGVAQFNIGGPVSYTAGQGQGIAIKILQSQLYIEAVATNNLDENSRLIVFGQNLTITYNGGNDVVRDFIRFNATGQRTIGGAAGIVATTEGTSPNTFMTVIGSDLINVQASLDELNNIVSGASRSDVASLINQFGTSLRNATVPGKGILGDPADVS